MRTRGEYKRALELFVTRLVWLGYELDLPRIDYEGSIDQMILHEFIDYAEVGDERSLRLAELRSLMRAVYIDGTPVVDCQAEIEYDSVRSLCDYMKTLTDGVCDGTGDFDFFGFSIKRVIRSPQQVLNTEKLLPGKYFLIRWERKPADLIQLTSVRGRLFYYKQFLGGDSWSDEKHLNLITVGVMPLEVGPKLTQVWNVSNYLERVM